MQKPVKKNNSFVGMKRADGTVYKLMSDDDLKKLMLDHIHGKMDIDALCKKHKITKSQFHRQKYYRDRVLGDLMEKIRVLRLLECNSGFISWMLNIPLDKINKIIIAINDEELKKLKGTIDIYADDPDEETEGGFERLS